MLLSWLRRFRPSNLVVLAASPFLIYSFASSSRYTRALAYVLGIEQDAWILLSLFLLASAATLLGLAALFYAWGALAPDKGEEEIQQRLKRSLLFFTLHLGLIAIAGFVVDPTVYIRSILVNDLDIQTTTWVVVNGQDRIVDPEILLWFQELIEQCAAAYLLVAVSGVLAYQYLRKTRHLRILKLGLLGVGACNLGLFFYCTMVAHAGFATGLMATLRATFIAYGIASVLGLVWALLSDLKVKARTYPVCLGIGAVFLAVSIWYFSQPRTEVVLVGTLDAKVAIVKGTPQSVTDQIRDGEAFDLGGKVVKVRSLATVEKAIKLLDGHRSVSAALIPASDFQGQWPELWRTTYLPKDDSVPAYTTLVLGMMVLMLTGAGFVYRRHPLRVFSEFIVDTLRGIPMLVIVLYIGLPLAGAVKDLSGGVINLSNIYRGIIAIGVGYSAYMAEIFRAGIEAVPKGQIEAARTMGMKEWMIARFIILPQAIKIITPALGNEFIAMLKDTALLSILSVRDVTQRMREFQATTFLAFAPYNTAALLYVALTLAASSVLKSIERRQKVGER